MLLYLEAFSAEGSLLQSVIQGKLAQLLKRHFF